MAAIDDFQTHFSEGYEVDRKGIQHGERLSITDGEHHINLDFFATGTIRVNGPTCELKDQAQKVLDSFRKNRKFFEKATAAAQPPTPEEEVLKIITRELCDFLPDHDRRTLRVAFQILRSEPPFEDYSPAAMAVSRVYEGFLSKMLVRLGIVTQTRVSDPDFSFNAVFDSADAKAFKAKANTHAGELDAMKQRLKEFHHTNMHSNSSQFVEYTDVKDAHRFATRVLTDMQGYFQYFGKYMPK